MRWQDVRREIMVSELRKVGTDCGFVEDEFSEEGSEEEGEDAVEMGMQDGAPVGSQMQI